MIDFSAVFIYFFAVIDPIGTVPVFIAVTRGYDAATKRKVAVIATIVATGVLLSFVLLGELVLTAMNIPLSAFAVAGGAVLFLFALSMIFGESKPEEEVRLVEKAKDSAIFPLAIPSIAGPGAMLASVLLTEKARFGFSEQAQTAAIMVGVLLVNLVLMVAASFIHRFIGNAGASIVSRVMGLILASAAASSILDGIKKYFEL